jgi:aflatoxin B1 aldehyde reductase
VIQSSVCSPLRPWAKTEVVGLSTHSVPAAEVSVLVVMSSASTQSKKPPHLVLGCANFSSAGPSWIAKHTTLDQACSIFRIFQSYGHSIIDTSRRYPPTAPGTSEDLIGQALRAFPESSIQIDTKTLSDPGDHKPENLQTSISKSLAALNAPSVRTIYLHFPDRSVPLSSPVSTLSNAVSSGLAQQWGISNYTLEDLHEIMRLCEQNNWIKPATYQGEYNALSRDSEPIIQFCHDHGMAFYAYSPGAGGVFSPSGSRIVSDSPVGQRVRALYGSEEMQAAVQKVREVAKGKGLGGHEVAMRWAFWDGMLNENDGVIVGVGAASQLKDTCEFLRKGRLDDEVRAAVEGVWATVKK